MPRNVTGRMLELATPTTKTGVRSGRFSKCYTRPVIRRSFMPPLFASVTTRSRLRRPARQAVAGAHRARPRHRRVSLTIDRGAAARHSRTERLRQDDAAEAAGGRRSTPAAARRGSTAGTSPPFRRGSSPGAWPSSRRRRSSRSTTRVLEIALMGRYPHAGRVRDRRAGRPRGRACRARRHGHAPTSRRARFRRSAAAKSSASSSRPRSRSSMQRTRDEPRSATRAARRCCSSTSRRRRSI